MKYIISFILALSDFQNHAQSQITLPGLQVFQKEPDF